MGLRDALFHGFGTLTLQSASAVEVLIRSRLPHLDEVAPLPHLPYTVFLESEDLRRTARSWLASSGESLVMIGKALNQSTLSTTEVYSHLAQDPLREMLERHGEKIIQFVELNE